MPLALTKEAPHEDLMDSPDPAPRSGVRHRRKLHVTITDVASMAKVSVASVSRFINAPETVSLPMGARIAEALRTTGFRMRRSRPSKAVHAQAPVPQVVAFLTLGRVTAKEMMAMPAFPRLFEGVNQALQAAGGNLLYTHYQGDGPLPASLTDGSVQGILVFGRLEQMSAELLAALVAVPNAWVMRQHSDPLCRIDHVFYDNSQVGRLAADHLTSLGARRLAVINAIPNHEAYAQRQEAFLAVAHDLGVVAEAFTVGSGGAQNLRTAVQLAVLENTRPDGIFVPSDEQLLEVYHLLHSMGIEPGKHIHLIGCNNDPLLMVRMHPRPATIDIHLELLGERAVQQLSYRLAHPDSPPMQVFVNPTVVTADG